MRKILSWSLGVAVLFSGLFPASHFLAKEQPRPSVITGIFGIVLGQSYDVHDLQKCKTYDFEEAERPDMVTCEITPPEPGDLYEYYELTTTMDPESTVQKDHPPGPEQKERGYLVSNIYGNSQFYEDVEQCQKEAAKEMARLKKQYGSPVNEATMKAPNGNILAFYPGRKNGLTFGLSLPENSEENCAFSITADYGAGPAMRKISEK